MKLQVVAASPSKRTQGANLLNSINWLVFVLDTGYFYNTGDAFL